MKHKRSVRTIPLLILTLAIGAAGIFSYADAKTKKPATPQKKQIGIKPAPKSAKTPPGAGKRISARPSAVASSGKPALAKKKPAVFKPKPLPPRIEEPMIVIIPNQPLIAPDTGTPGTLTRDGVIAWSNIQRGQNGGFTALAGNAQLNEIATIRLNDLFAKQYFAHNSPDTGDGASDVAKDVGYPYILIGENLALGDFGSDEKLVRAWMDSPAHRDNILRSGYTQIGVAVGTGIYKGEYAWMAVQIFGRPLSDCPSVDRNLKSEIDDAEQSIGANNVELEQRKTELAVLQPKTAAEVDSYNTRVHAYNALVNETNTLIAKIKDMIARYNAQVKAFNACVQS